MVFALKKKPPYRLTRFWQILTAALGAGLFWELITPLYKPDSTGDLWDIAAYILGGAVYFGLDKVIGYKSAKS
ncbi:MAG: hypothetical protein ACOX7J_04360 [Bacillota bacterium]